MTRRTWHLNDFRLMDGFRDKLPNVAIASGLALLAAVLYARTVYFPFVYFDDDAYVFNNPYVVSGLTWRGLAWAFTTGHAANWHPLTWISHMADSQVFGLAAGGHHAVNVALHALNSALLFHVLRRMTGAAGRSAFAAALFAVHPLNVESVAWVAERKNVLSMALLLASLLAYLRYVERPGTKRYTLTAFCFALGLLAKPMLVSLPFVLLLLDYWPLRRYDGTRQVGPLLKRSRTLVVEKVPLFMLSLISAIVTYLVQRHGEAMEALAGLSFYTRLANAASAYARYMGKLFWPASLSIIYPYNEDGPVSGFVLFILLLLVLLTMAVVLYRRRLPYTVVGWFWFLGTLVPVIGLVQVGYQSMADRYMYVPAVGIFIAASWGGYDLLSRRTRTGICAGLACVTVLLLFSVSWRQERVWSGTVPLFEHAIAVTSNNAAAHNHLGYYYLTENEPARAIVQFKAAHRIDPTLPATYTNWGAALRMQGDPEGAIAQYEEALRLNPDQAVPHANMGVALLHLGRIDEALDQLREAVRLDPSLANAHAYLGIALAIKGHVGEALDHLDQALTLDPNHAQARAALQALKDPAQKGSEDAEGQDL